MAKMKMSGANPSHPAEPPPSCIANKCKAIMKTRILLSLHNSGLRLPAPSPFTILPLEFSRYEAGDSFSFGHEPGMPSYGFGRDQTHEEPVSFPSEIE